MLNSGQSLTKQVVASEWSELVSSIREALCPRGLIISQWPQIVHQIGTGPPERVAGD